MTMTMEEPGYDKRDLSRSREPARRVYSMTYMGQVVTL